MTQYYPEHEELMSLSIQKNHKFLHVIFHNFHVEDNFLKISCYENSILRC